MLMEKHKIEIKDLLDDNKKVESNENYDKNKNYYDKKFKEYKLKLGKEWEMARDFEFYKSVAIKIKGVFEKKIGTKFTEDDLSKSDTTSRNMIKLNCGEYNCLIELCKVAGVKIDIPVEKSHFLINNVLIDESFVLENDFLKLRSSIISGLAKKKLITLKNDNDNPSNKTFICDENILFNIIKQFSSFSAGVEKQFQMDEKIETPTFYAGSKDYQKLSLEQICMAKDFLDCLTEYFDGEKYGEIPSCIKNIFEKNFNGNIDDFDIEVFENICIKKLLNLKSYHGKWHQEDRIFKQDFNLNKKLKMLDFYYKELLKLTENKISPRLRLAFIFSLHTGWCSEYARDIIKQKQMDNKFENLFCAINALQTYNSSQLNSGNLVHDLRSVLNFMKEQGIIVYGDNILGDLNLDISNKDYVWSILKYFFTWFMTFCSGNFKVKNYMKAERFVLYLKNHYLKVNLKLDNWIDETMNLFDAIEYMRDYILRRRPDEIELEKIGGTHGWRTPKDYHYYKLIDDSDSKYIPLKDQKMIAESKNFRGY